MAATKPKYDAILIVESRGMAPGVRSLGLSQQWTRLYHAAHYIIDLSTKLEGKTFTLYGHVLPANDGAPPSAGTALLTPEADSAKTQETHLGSEGDFVFNLSAAGCYFISIDVSDAIMVLPKCCFA
jgi:hypothetical protein